MALGGQPLAEQVSQYKQAIVWHSVFFATEPHRCFASSPRHSSPLDPNQLSVRAGTGTFPRVYC